MKFKSKSGAPAATTSNATAPAATPAKENLSQTSLTESSSFAERTKVTGFAPPPRTMTFTNVLAEERLRAQTMARIGKVFAILCVPLTAGGVFWFLSSQDDPSLKPHAVARAPHIVVAAAPVEVKPTATPTPALPVAPIAEVPTRPLIPFSSKPADRDQLLPLSREQSGFFFAREELGNLRGFLQNDQSAQAIANQLKSFCDEALKHAPHPTETFNAKTPGESAFVQLALNDLFEVQSLYQAAVVFNQAPYYDHLKKHLLSWAATYKPTGDSGADVRLTPVFAAYPLAALRMTEEERRVFESWMLQIGDRQITEATARGISNDIWFAHHLETMTYVGYLAGNGNFQNYVKLNFSTHLVASIREDGSTAIFKERDSIAAHMDHITSLLRASKILLRAGRADKESLPVLGSPFARAMDFAMPFPTGAQTRNEFTNVTDLDFKQKQAAQMPGTIAHPFQRAEGADFLEASAFFRPSVVSFIPQTYGLTNINFGSANALMTSSLNRRTLEFENRPVPQAQAAAKPTAQPVAPTTAQSTTATAVTPAVPAAASRQPATPQH